MSSRSAAGTGTIRKKTIKRNGKEYTYWEARYTVGYDPGTGKQIQRSISGKTQKEVAQKLKAATVAIDEGAYFEPSKMRLGEWLDLWAEEHCTGLKPRTLILYQGHIKNHLKPFLGHTRLSALTPTLIQQLYNRFLSGKDGAQKLSAKTIKNLHGVLHKALWQAVELGYMKQNPCDRCTPPRAEKAQIKPLDDVAIGAFLDAIKGHPFERVFVVDLFTGMRQSEIIGLTWDCVDFDTSAIRVYRQLQLIEGKYRFGSLKNDKPRLIVPAPSVMAVLRDQRRRQLEMQLRAGELWSNPEGFVFTDEIGRHLARNTLYKQYKKVAAAIGMPEARFHDLRHSYAVAALQAGDDVKTVQENLGHHTAAFTLDVYGHVTAQMRRRSADRMEDYIRSIQTAH